MNHVIRVCSKCKSSKYMYDIKNYSNMYFYKCTNCNTYFRKEELNDMDEPEKLTLRDFLRNRTSVMELCIIREDGWKVGAVWVDNEDLWTKCISSYMLCKIVKKDEWGVIQVLEQSGLPTTIPCHYINV